MSRWTQKPPLGTTVDWSHPLSRGLALCLLMNEGSGNKISDLSGNGNHGTLTGMTPSASPTGWVPGKDGVALAFDGVNDYVDCGKKVTLTLGNRDFTIRIRLNALTQTEVGVSVIDKGSGDFSATPTTQIGFSLIQVWWGSSNYNFFLHGGGVCNQLSFPNFDLMGDVEAAIVSTGALLIGYLQGSRYVVTARTVTTIDVDQPLNIGRWREYDREFKGVISSVSLYNRALSAQEIWQLYAEPYCFIQRATKNYWQMPLSSRGLVTFDRVLTPAGSFWPTHNPNYGDGYVRTTRRHQPKGFCGADVYSYNKGKSGDFFLGWNRMPAADLAALETYFNDIRGHVNKFVFTDRDGGVHTAKLIKDSLTWREVEPGFYDVRVDLDLS